MTARTMRSPTPTLTSMSGPEGSPANPTEDASAAWFEPLTLPLEQGDVLGDFPLPTISYDESTDTLGISRARVAAIVLTQSCDIQKPAQTELLLASVFDFDDLRNSGTDNFRSSDYRKSLSRGTNVSDFAMPPKPSGNGQFLVVSFRKLHVVPKHYVVSNMSTDAIRLRSPYKEYFAQAYARYMMRVGLPLTLPEIR